MASTHARRVVDIQRALRDAGGVDGWLFYDFRGSDPLSYRVLLLDAAQHVTRCWYYWIPTDGEPVKIMHRIEPHVLETLPGHTSLYVSWNEQRACVARLLAGQHRIAMQYSPMNAVPYVSRVDAGTVDVIRSLGVEVCTSADLVQRFEAVWGEPQVASHRAAAEALRRIVDDTFARVGATIAARQPLDEYILQQFIVSRIEAHGLTTSSVPIVAVNAHSADPHYTPSRHGSAPIREDDLILIDLWAKQQTPGSVYADITWTGYVGRSVPPRPADIFSIVRTARDTAVAFLRDQIAAGAFPCGWEVDDQCRRVIREAGYGAQFFHRTGHSIGEEVHGNGANIDSLETRDDRRLLPHTCFSIEPGIYLAGEFGIRSELDVFVDTETITIFGQPVQTEIVPILA